MKLVHIYSAAISDAPVRS